MFVCTSDITSIERVPLAVYDARCSLSLAPHPCPLVLFLGGDGLLMQDLLSNMDFNSDGVITRQEVAELALQLRNQLPVGGGRYDSTHGNDSWASRSPADGSRSVGTDRTASDFSGSGATPSPILPHNVSPSHSEQPQMMYKRDVKTLEGVYTGPMLLDPAGALVKHGENGTMHYSNGECDVEP